MRVPPQELQQEVSIPDTNSMDHTLRCNVLKCRKELNDHAVVTTCSHVFCHDCSNQFQLSGQRDGQRPICPACDMLLSNPDDVVVTNLNPTEDYKTSVLSGLNPNTIMECAGRALSFWAYQTAQEIVYQEYLAKNLTNKYATLNNQMDKIIHDANAEISTLRHKLSDLRVDHDGLRRKNEELKEAYKEKTRKHMQTQELYDKLKRRAMIGQVQEAALDAVDHTIQASVAQDRYTDRLGDEPKRPPPPLFSNQQAGDSQQYNQQSHASTHITESVPVGGWAGFSSQGSGQQSQVLQTPSTHRQRLGAGNGPPQGLGLANLQSNRVANTPLSSRRVSPRNPLGSLSANIGTPSGFAGYGMSAGLKVSNPSAVGTGGYARPPIPRSRVAQRPSPTDGRNSAFEPSRSSNMFANPDSRY